jgi:hypothetical protein
MSDDERHVEQLAAAYDLEVATGRVRRSTVATVVAVLVVAGSTLALVGDAQPGASGTPVVAAVEVAAVLLGYLVLGRRLGLRAES